MSKLVRHLHRDRIDMSLSGRSAIILGGFGGIGLAICDELLAHGIPKLAVIDISELPEAPTRFGSIQFVSRKVSVEDSEALRAAFEDIRTAFGHVDLIVNSVGVLDEGNYLRTLAINAGGAITSTLLGVEIMRRDRGGKGGQIVNIGSIASYTPMLAIPAYTASVHAVLGFTKSLAVEPFESLTGVKFAVVCPGVTMTNMYGTSVAEKKLFPEFEELYNEVLKTLETQDPQSVARCVVERALEAPNGQVLEVVGGNVRQI